MKFVSLFTGFAGLDLGLERSGMQCVAQVEINPFAHKYILEPHFPETRKFYDVRNVEKKHFRGLGTIDLICGGFPCQDISPANPNGKGLEGPRSSLYREQLRIINELRPRYTVIENSSRITQRGLDIILSELTRFGYDAEWQCLCASDFGYSHERKRLFLVAYAQSCRLEKTTLFNESCFVGFKCQQASLSFVRPEGIKNFYPRIPTHLGMDDGIPTRMDNKTLAEITQGLGNAVIPEIGEWLGKQIIEFDKNYMEGK